MIHGMQNSTNENINSYVVVLTDETKILEQKIQAENQNITLLTSSNENFNYAEPRHFYLLK
jgi:hypothetical protein